MTKLQTYVSHFSGVGGACLGLHNAGLKCLLAIDNWDKAIEYRQKNLLDGIGICTDIREFEHLDRHAADVLWTSPPCQTFSMGLRPQYVNQKLTSDERNVLFLQSLLYVERFKPKYFILENVPGLMTHQGGTTLKNMLSAFKQAGYVVEWNILNALDFGLPQIRHRLFMVGSRDKKTGLIPKEPKQSQLPDISSIMEKGVCSSWAPETYRTAYRKVERANVDITVTLPNMPFKRTITCGWGGGPTRKKIAVLDQIEVNGNKISYLRNPTMKEGSRAQGFPDTWIWPDNQTDAWSMIGNAVVPKVASAIIDHLQKIENNERPAYKKVLPAKAGGHWISSEVKETSGLPPTIFA